MFEAKGRGEKEISHFSVFPQLSPDRKVLSLACSQAIEICASELADINSCYPPQQRLLVFLALIGERVASLCGREKLIVVIGSLIGL